MPARLLRLHPRELLLLAEAWLTLAWIDLGIRLLPFRFWRRWLAPGPSEPAPAAPARIAPLVTATERAARHHLLPMNCLRRSLALQRLLRRRRLSSRLHIGVRKGDAALEAHAWLSSGGRILNDTPDVSHRYAELKPQQWGRVIAGDPETITR